MDITDYEDGDSGGTSRPDQNSPRNLSPDPLHSIVDDTDAPVRLPSSRAVVADDPRRGIRRSREEDSDDDSQSAADYERRAAQARMPPLRKARRNLTKAAIEHADEKCRSHMARIPLSVMGPGGQRVCLSFSTLMKDIETHILGFINAWPESSADPKRARMLRAEVEFMSKMVSPALEAGELEARVTAYPAHDNWLASDWNNFLEVMSRIHGLVYSREFRNVVLITEDKLRALPLKRDTYLDYNVSIRKWIQDMRKANADPMFRVAAHQLKTNPRPFETIMEATTKDNNEGDIFRNARFRRGVYAWGRDCPGGIDVSRILELPFRKSFLETLSFDSEGNIQSVRELIQKTASKIREMVRETNYFEWHGPQNRDDEYDFAGHQTLDANPDDFKEYVDYFLDDVTGVTRRPPVDDPTTMANGANGDIRQFARNARLGHARQPHELMIDYLFRQQGYTDEEDLRIFYYWVGMAALENAFDDEDDDDIDWKRVERRQSNRTILFISGQSGTGKNTILSAVKALLVQPPTLLRTDAHDMFLQSCMLRPMSMLQIEDAAAKNATDFDPIMNKFLDYTTNDDIVVRKMQTQTDSESTRLPPRGIYEQPRACIAGTANGWGPRRDEHRRRMAYFIFAQTTQKKDEGIKQTVLEEAYKLLFKAAFWYVVCRIRFDRSSDPTTWWSAHGRSRLESWLTGSSVLDRFVRDALMKREHSKIPIDARFFERMVAWQRMLNDPAMQRFTLPSTAADFQRRMQNLAYEQRADSSGTMVLYISGYGWNEQLFHPTANGERVVNDGPPREPAFADVPFVLRDEHGNEVTELQETVLFH